MAICEFENGTKAAREVGIWNLVHPPSSPDLNAIELLSIIVKSKVSAMKPEAGNLERLWKQMQVAWVEIEIETVNKLVASMERRWQAVCQAQGDFRLGSKQ